MDGDAVLGGGYVQGATFCPSDPNRMYLYVDVGGPYRSDDGARTWRRVSDESPNEISQIPGDPRIVGLFGRQHVMVSEDGGETWAPFEDGLLVNATPKTEPWADGAYYAIGAGRDFLLLGDGNGNKYRRGRDESAWTRLPDGQMLVGDPVNEPWLQGRPQEDIRMTALMTLVADPKDDAHWLATDWFELWETRDAGATWTTRLKGIMQLVSYDIAFDPNSADNFICCLYDMGAYVTRDGGRTFVRPRVAAGVGGDRKFPNNVATALYMAGQPGVVLCVGARGFEPASGAALTPASRGFRCRGPGCRRLSRTRAPRRVSSRTRATAPCY